MSESSLASWFDYASAVNNSNVKLFSMPLDASQCVASSMIFITAHGYFSFFIQKVLPIIRLQSKSCIFWIHNYKSKTVIYLQCPTQLLLSTIILVSHGSFKIRYLFRGWTGHLAYRASSQWAIGPMWAGPVRYVFYLFVCFFFSKFPPIGPANWLQRAPASPHIIGLLLD